MMVAGKRSTAESGDVAWGSPLCVGGAHLAGPVLPAGHAPAGGLGPPVRRIDSRRFLRGLFRPGSPAAGKKCR